MTGWSKTMNEHSHKNKSKVSLITFLILVGLELAYVNQMSPSPLLLRISEQFNIVNNDALLNLSISIIFPMYIVASIAGGYIEQRIGTRKLYTWTLIFLSTGVLMNYIAVNYQIFLLGRILYGIGFGLGIPFIGSAIMKWYDKSKQELLNTVNGLFPYVGSVISFALIVPIYYLSGSWKHALGIWGFGFVIVCILWILLVKQQDVDFLTRTSESSKLEKGLYLNLWRRKDIKLLIIAFMCDFLCYAYLAIILPSLLLEAGHMTETVAGYLSAIAFPGAGIIGASMGGFILAKTGKRKPSMAAGQLLKLAGIICASTGNSTGLIILGVILFGLGNSMWLPGMYIVTMELEDMNPSRVGAAFSLISSCGFVAGFIAPTLGGWLTNWLMMISRISDPLQNHVFGLKWSLFVFGFTNLIAFICLLKLKETGSLNSNNSAVSIRS